MFTYSPPPLYYLECYDSYGELFYIRSVDTGYYFDCSDSLMPRLSYKKTPHSVFKVVIQYDVSYVVTFIGFTCYLKNLNLAFPD